MRLIVTILLIALPLCASEHFRPGRSWSFRHQAAAAGGLFDGLVSTNNLVAAWRFDESSAGSSAVTRTDSFGANNLTDVSTFAASATGIITNAVDIEADDVNALTITDNASLSMASGTSFTITCWVKLESIITTSPIISKGSGSGTSTEYVIFANSSTDWRCRVADTSNQGTVTNAVTPATNSWFFVAARCDLSADLIKLRINTTDAQVTYTGDTIDGSSGVNVGRLVYSTATRIDGMIDEMYVWKRVLTDQEITDMYNSGAGRDL